VTSISSKPAPFPSIDAKKVVAIISIVARTTRMNPWPSKVPRFRRKTFTNRHNKGSDQNTDQPSNDITAIQNLSSNPMQVRSLSRAFHKARADRPQHAAFHTAGNIPSPFRKPRAVPESPQQSVY
jgi:hypothetical protein